MSPNDGSKIIWKETFSVKFNQYATKDMLPFRAVGLNFQAVSRKCLGMSKLMKEGNEKLIQIAKGVYSDDTKTTASA
jgi:hypothetical protein